MRAKILNASAGSGKTYQLVYQYIYDVIKEPSLYRHILAVTFTNKATEEMKTRILKRVDELASNKPSEYLSTLERELQLDERTIRDRAKEVRNRILHDYSRFTVLTIDKFFQRIMRAFIKELGIDLNYNIELETANLLTKSTDSLIEEVTVKQDLLRWMTEFTEERLENSDKWDIRDSIRLLGKELFKEENRANIINAKSKDELRDIVERMTQRVKQSHARLQKVAQEAVSLLDSLQLNYTHFKGGATRSIAKIFYTIASGEIKSPSDASRKKFDDPKEWCTVKTPAEGVSIVPRLQGYFADICKIYDTTEREANTCSLIRENYRSFALLSDLYEQVQEMCNRQNIMLLSETKHILAEFIGNNDAPFIYEKVGNRYSRFMIDEFQDTSTKEWENFLPLLQNAMSQSEESSVFIVGDIKQSIYRWRGGDWRILHSKARHALGEEDTEIKVLEENYRSEKNVVEFNNGIIGRMVEIDSKALEMTLKSAVEKGTLSKESADELSVTLTNAYYRHAQQPCHTSQNEGYISVETFEEEPPVIECIKSLIDKGYKPSDIMILVRKASEGSRVATQLLDFKQHNKDPRYHFDVMTREALIIGNAPICTFIIAALKLAISPKDLLSRAIYNHYLHRPFDEELSEEKQRFFNSIKTVSPEEAFEKIIIEHELQSDKLQTAYIQALHEQIIAFCSKKIADIALFLEWWEEQGAQQSISVEKSESTIEITTIHKAKGLEQRAVILPYCSWTLPPVSQGQVRNIIWAEARDTDDEIGRLPVKYQKKMADSHFSEDYYRELVYSHVDNINLVYVALTRAKESLHIFVPAKKMESKSGINNVGALLMASLQNLQDAPDSHMPPCHKSSSDAGLKFEFGEFTGPEKQKKEAQDNYIVLENYLSEEPQPKLKLPSKRYLEDGEHDIISPRNLGIMMHKAFENAVNEEDILTEVDNMERDGKLSAEGAMELKQRISEAMSDERVHDWFHGSWRKVINEQDIIIPGSRESKRPDRVMIDGERVVIVDYKFGDNIIKAHGTQISDYLDLLRQMGYPHPKGYLWYVKLGRIIEVE